MPASNSAREENSAAILSRRKINHCIRVPTARDLKEEGGRWHEGKRGSGLLELCEH